MKMVSFSFGSFRKAVSLTLLVSLLSVAASVQPAQADSVSDLQRQQALLEQQAAQAQAQAQNNQTLAQQAASAIQDLSGKISQLHSSISATQSSISDTQNSMADADQQLAALESQMGVIKSQEAAMLRELYIMEVSRGDVLQYFSDESISQKERDQAQSTALETYLTGTFAQLTAAKQQEQDQRDSLAEKSQYLATLQSQQQDQQVTLADAKNTQQAVQSNATAAEQKLEQQAAAAKAQAAQIAAKIQLLSQTTNWGTQIVSSDDPNTYYTQTGDYTHLGYSSETVNNVGCLITSIAMASTTLGHRITPDYMAQNATFSSGGSYYWGTPASLQINLQPSGRVNWAVVQAQLALGLPVIISIYLASVGAINSDGSSHYVMLKGYADGKYFMQDPIGHGRGYNMNQVRSMILVSRK